MAGYSNTPLPVKLGIRAGLRVCVLGAPPDFGRTLGTLADGVVWRSRLGSEHDVIVCFVRRRSQLARRLARLQGALAPAGGLWIAWPKVSSGVSTDVTENAIRELALPTGLVDNKVCAIDQTWSGLRLVLRRELRPGAPRGRE